MSSGVLIRIAISGCATGISRSPNSSTALVPGEGGPKAIHSAASFGGASGRPSIECNSTVTLEFSDRNSGSRGASQLTDNNIETPTTSGDPSGADMASVADSIRPSASPTTASSLRPASVRVTPAGARSKSGRPKCASSDRICWLTAGGDMARRSAARAKLPARAAVSNTRNQFREGIRLAMFQHKLSLTHRARDVSFLCKIPV